MVQMFLIVLTFLSCLIWFYLLLFNGRFWFGAEDLSNANDLKVWPEVVAVIPARNEAETIGEVVKAHLESDYPGKFSIVVVDDQSDDGTGDIVRSVAQSGAKEVAVVSGKLLPAGWSGKLWAVHNGLQQAQDLHPSAKYVLLTDADIVHAPGNLSKLVSKAESDRRVLVSVMAMLDARGFWGSFLMPAFVFFFQKLYPFPSTNNPSSGVAGAAGGCMLVDWNTLREIGGVEAIRGSLIDDCSLALALKDPDGQKRSIWLGFDKGVVSLRDNREFKTIWTMIKRTAFTQLRYSKLALIGAVIAMVLTYLVGPAVLLTFVFHQSMMGLVLGGVAYIAAMLSYWPTLQRYGKSSVWLLLLPVCAVIYTIMIIASALSHWSGRGGAWKGRTYPKS